MGVSDGLSRGLEVTNTGAPIPLAKKPLAGLLTYWAIPLTKSTRKRQRTHVHRKAPSYEDQIGDNEVLETGIKVIDLICPFARGGKVGLFAAPEQARL